MNSLIYKPWFQASGEQGSVVIKFTQMAVCQNLVPLVNIKIAGKWMFIPLKMVLIGIDPYPDGRKLIFLASTMATMWIDLEISTSVCVRKSVGRGTMWSAKLVMITSMVPRNVRPMSQPGGKA